MASNPTGRQCRQQAKPQESEIDEATVVGCQAGDRTAQERLYKMYDDRVYRLMVRMVGSQEAVDATQQVFLQVFRKIGQFAGKSRFTTWLFRLAVNEALQYRRKGKRWNFFPLKQEPATRQVAPEQRSEHLDLLEQALAQLEAELRAVFVLREVENLPYREIAVAVGIPEGTVGSRLNRARRELQEHLTRLGWDPHA